MFKICYLQRKQKRFSCFLLALLSLLLCFLLVAFIVGSVRAETLTDKQAQLNEIWNQLGKVTQNLENSLNSKDSTIQELLEIKTNSEQKINDLETQLNDLKSSNSLTESQWEQSEKSLSEAEQSLTALQKQIKWFKIRGWLLLGLGILAGHFI